MYIIDVLFILYYLFNIKNIKKTLFASILLILFISSASISQRTYYYLVNGSVLKAPMTGIQLITPQLFLSDSSSIKLFNNQEEIDFLNKIYEQLEAKQLNWGANNPYTIQSYGKVYNNILHGTVNPTFAVMHNAKNYIMMYHQNPELTKQLDQLTISIALKLMSANFLKFAEFYYTIIVDSMALSVKFIADIGRYYALALLIELCFFLYLFLKTRKAIFFAFSFITIIHFMNYGLVAIVEPLLLRYRFYTDTLQLAFQVIFLYYILMFIFDNLLKFKHKLSFIWQGRVVAL